MPQSLFTMVCESKKRENPSQSPRFFPQKGSSHKNGHDNNIQGCLFRFYKTLDSYSANATDYEDTVNLAQDW